MKLNRRTFVRSLGQGGAAFLLMAGTKALLSGCDRRLPDSRQVSPSPQISARGLLQPGQLAWGASPEDGAPYVFYDPTNPRQIVGFEVEIATAIARLLGAEPVLVNSLYAQLAVTLAANRIDLILNGWEITPERRRLQLFSQPYYRYGQQIVVRADDARFREYDPVSEIDLGILAGMKVGTGLGYKAQDILQQTPRIQTVTYPESDDYLAYLENGAIDAILLDTPIVAYNVLGKGIGGQTRPRLRPIGQPLFLDDYVIAFNAKSAKGKILREEVNEALSLLKKDGTLRQIYERWGLWNDDQAQIGIV
ncbi:ABC transporter substrate-binding protein [Thermosynechococcus sp.]|uniref:ABC transporter substrate-binding protein n=1 Tax=Thermosynechococcus sp. TaxID=2814275 RepID=UPI00391DA315